MPALTAWAPGAHHPGVGRSTLPLRPQGTVHAASPSFWLPLGASVRSNEYSGLTSFSMDWSDLLEVQGTLKSLLQHHSSKAHIAAVLASSFPVSVCWWPSFLCVPVCPGFPSSSGHQSSGPTPVPPHPHRLHSQGQDTIRHTPNSQHRCGIRGTVPMLSRSGSPPVARHVTSNLPESLFPEPRFPTC